jgi:hypothetical protein
VLLVADVRTTVVPGVTGHDSQILSPHTGHLVPEHLLQLDGLAEHIER